MHRRVARARNVRKVAIAQRRVERTKTFDQRSRFEVCRAARGVQVTRRFEAVLLEVHEREAPTSPGNRLATVTASGATRGRLFGAVQPWQSRVQGTKPRGIEPASYVGRYGRRLSPFGRLDGREKRLRPFERRTTHVKPERRFAITVKIRHAFAEAQLSLLDTRMTAAAFGAPGFRSFERMRTHDGAASERARRSRAAGRSAASTSTGASGSGSPAIRCGTVLIVYCPTSSRGVT